MLTPPSQGQAAELEEASTERLAVIGSPISHSRSPAIHAAAYRELGLAWKYERDEVREGELESYLETHHEGVRGLSLTMPLKEEAHDLASILDPIAVDSGVVNTLLRLDSEKHPWAGFNTDVGGLAAALQRAELNPEHTVILGAGATAVSAVLAAHMLGAERITVLARRREPAEEIADDYKTRAAVLGSSQALTASGGATLCISTLPGTAGDELELPDPLLQSPLFDVAYDPWPSSLATRWQHAGGAIHSGLSMLVEQALLQIRIFHNGDPGFALEGEERVLAAMYAAVSGVGD